MRINGIRPCLHFLSVILLFTSIVCADDSELPYMQTTAPDLRSRDRLTFLVFGDAGTGYAGQYRVGKAMYEVCKTRKCDFALMLGDNIYQNGIVVRDLSSAEASMSEIQVQFRKKFEDPYADFLTFDHFKFWAVVGNHDYRSNSTYSQVLYSQFSQLWRMPAYNYEVPYLPDWIQIYGLNTDTDERKDMNGLQAFAAKKALCAPEHEERWKFVFGHQPAHNFGHHEGRSQETKLRALLESVFQGCGVDIYFSGHSHHQEHLSAKGYEQIIQGAGGKSKGSNRCSRPEAGLDQHYFSQDYGFAAVEVNDEEVKIDFYSVLNTREKDRNFTIPQPSEIVLKYSWISGKDAIGNPSAGGKCAVKNP